MSAADAAYSGQVSVTCTNGTFDVGWDNSNPYFADKGNIAAHYCDIVQHTGYVSDNLVDISLRYYNGIIPSVNPNPTQQDTSTSTSETQTVVDSPTVTVTDTPTTVQDTPTVVVDTPTVVVDTETASTESPTSIVDSGTPVVLPSETQTLTSESSTQTSPSETSTVPVEIPLPTPVPVVVPEPVVVVPQPTPQPEPMPEPSVPVTDEEAPSEEPALEVPPVVEEQPPVEEVIEHPEEAETPSIPDETPELPSPAPEPLPEPIEEPVTETQPDIPYVPPVQPQVIEASSVDLTTLDPDTPVLLDNGVVLTAEVVLGLQMLENPAELLSELFTDPGAVLAALGTVGADMSPQARQKSQDAVVQAVVVGSIITQAAGAAAYRRKP